MPTKPANNMQPCISLVALREWVPEEARKRITLTEAHQIISRQFCAVIATRGVCPMDCDQCKHEIVDLFRLETARRPGAVLTWTAKDHAAKWIERLIEAQKQAEQNIPALENPHDALESLFQKRDSNPFEELLKQYE